MKTCMLLSVILVRKFKKKTTRFLECTRRTSIKEIDASYCNISNKK